MVLLCISGQLPSFMTYSPGILYLLHAVLACVHQLCEHMCICFPRAAGASEPVKSRVEQVVQSCVAVAGMLLSVIAALLVLMTARTA